MGIVDARRKFVSEGHPTQGQSEEYGSVFVDRPYEADREASEAAGADTGYLRLIKRTKAETGDQGYQGARTHE